MAIDEKPSHAPGTVPRGPRPLPPELVEPGDGPLGPDPEEQAIVERAQGGDADAFRELVERTQDRIYRLAMRVLRCDPATAEDLCQEIYLRAFRGLPRFDGAVRFGTWLHTIAMNACISEYRRRRTLKRGSHRTLSIDAPVGGHEDLHIEPPSREVEPSARVDQRDFAEAVRVAIADLPEEFRHAVLLRDMQGLAYEEIGEILGVPPGTVRSRIHRGRLILQVSLREYAE